jgi:hypothetical protein
MSEILHLTLKREYFAQIAKKQKHTEFRKRKPYWRKRLEGRKFDEIKFRNGYGKNVPERSRVGKGRGAEYAIRLGRVLEIKRWRT